MKDSVSIIVPVLNEEKNILVLYEKLKANLKNVRYEILFINDGSTDDSEKIIRKLTKKDKSVKLVNLSRNFGHQAAISCGIDYAGANAAIIMDCDLQDPPELIPAMIKKWQGGYDVVYGIRKSRKGESYFKLISANIFYNVLNILSGTSIPKNVGDFRLISAKVLAVVKTTREYHRFIRGIISWAGFKQIGIEYNRKERIFGYSKYNTFRMLQFAFDAMFSFSFFPLRIALLMGLTSAFGAIVYIFYTLYLSSEGVTVRGWPSTIVIILFLGSVQLVSIGIVGEYIGRIYQEVKKRPIYIVSSMTGSKNSK